MLVHELSSVCLRHQYCVGADHGHKLSCGSQFAICSKNIGVHDTVESADSPCPHPRLQARRPHRAPTAGLLRGVTMKLIALTTIAMIAFAANSVLARLAFASAGAEPVSYTGIRLAAGAVTLAVLLALRRQSVRPAGSWYGAAALFGYAILFSVAYILLGAGTGALILFASVQIGILGWAIYKGDRPSAIEWAGFIVAFAGLVYLVSPGMVAPNPLGALL